MGKGDSNPDGLTYLREVSLKNISRMVVIDVKN